MRSPLFEPADIRGMHLANRFVRSATWEGMADDEGAILKTSAILSLALERLGHRNHALYDGSWAEWGMYDDLKVAKG